MIRTTVHHTGDGFLRPAAPSDCWGPASLEGVRRLSTSHGCSPCLSGTSWRWWPSPRQFEMMTLAVHPRRGLLRPGELLGGAGEEGGTHTRAIAVWGMLESPGPRPPAEPGDGGWWH